MGLAVKLKHLIDVVEYLLSGSLSWLFFWQIAGILSFYMQLDAYL